MIGHGAERREAGALRPTLLGILFLGIVGTAAELLLIGHTESATQLIPLGALGLGLASGVLVALRPRPRTLWILRATMGLFLVAGVLGLYLHYRGNREFELEMDPSMSGLELVWETLTGATPALAPASMAWLGLLGLAYAFRHPLADRERAPRSPRPGVNGPARLNEESFQGEETT
ncbi:MAG: hypothetical protein ACRELC_06260 [Gemmatimonadota bacterium]